MQNKTPSTDLPNIIQNEINDTCHDAVRRDSKRMINQRTAARRVYVHRMVYESKPLQTQANMDKASLK